MPEKKKPVGVCDLCGSKILPAQWLTSKGHPRLYCSLECKQTANSRAGNPKRVAAIRRRIASGQWKNPRSALSPEELHALQSSAARKGRLREVAEKRWRNPALSEAARRKLSCPRKHTGALHRAIEKLRCGSISELMDEEATAYREYRRQLRQKKSAPK
ncbi:MAG: hypothetical protein N2117_12935 [Anaerolineales bacterium]|nr:hypothetical protein [Anaerolineales bacterium]